MEPLPADRDELAELWDLAQRSLRNAALEGLTEDRYGLEPFRRRGQRSTTVMLRASPSFVDETLWPEFVELNKVLHRHLHEVTQTLIARTIHPDMTDVRERPAAEPGSLETRERGDSPRE